MRSLCLILLLVMLVASVQAQQPAAARDTARALELYQSGEVEQAIDKLTEITKRRPDEPEAWEALASVLERQGRFGYARPALERLVVLRPNAGDVHARLAYVLILGDQRERAMAEGERALTLGDHRVEAHYAIAEGHFRSGDYAKALVAADIALSINADFTPALITKSMAHSNMQQYQDAAASLERVVALAPNDIDADTWRGQIQELKLRASQLQLVPSLADPPTLSGKDVTQKARVMTKPEPSYTDQARLAGITGTVVLKAIFSAEGEVKHIFIVRALGYGLTTKAVQAARLIKFNPATKDDRPVSMFIQMEYNFNLY